MCGERESCEGLEVDRLCVVTHDRSFTARGFSTATQEQE
jgi:hypothetical protein